MKKIFLLFNIFTLSFTIAHAQEGDKWFVTPDIGINFKCSPPEAYSLFPYLGTNGDDSAYSRGNGTSIADTNGNLLFYTTDLSLYNRNRQIMPHGHDSLGFNVQKTYSSIDNSTFLVPDPGNINRYYVFFIDLYADPSKSWGCMDVCYSLVDMRLDNGLGDVAEVKRHLLKQSFNDTMDGVVTANFGLTNAFGLSAVRNKNKHDFWVTTVEAYGFASSNPPPDSLVVFSVTASGVSWHKLPLNYYAISYPDTHFTPDGKRMALYDNASNPRYMLYNFDDGNGSISNPLRLKAPIAMSSTAFSPDNTKMYVYSYSLSGYVYQYDVTAGNDTAIINRSMQVIDSDTLPLAYTNYWEDLRLAADGKIYGINNATETWSGAIYLRAIEKPNEPGAKCIPDDYAIKIDMPYPAGVTFSPFIPGYPPHFVTRKQEIMPYDISNFCSNSPVVFTPFKNFFSPTYHWDFGDPASGGSDVSTKRTGTHLYNTPGTYKVHFAAWNYDSIMDTFTRFVCISQGLSTVKMDTILCSGETITLDAGNPGASYIWNSKFVSNPWDNDTIETKTVAPGIYWVNVTNGSCTITDTAHVLNISTAKINLGRDTTIKNGVTLTLRSGYAATIWSTGAVGDSIQVTKAGTYWAALKGDKCETSDTIHITQNAGIKNYDGNSYSVLQLYPNPAHGTLGVSFNTVFTTEFTIGIYDMNGKKVLEQKYNSAAGENTFNLNISSLAPGDYILNMVSANFSTSRKFVVGE